MYALLVCLTSATLGGEKRNDCRLVVSNERPGNNFIILPLFYLTKKNGIGREAVYLLHVNHHAELALLH